MIFNGKCAHEVHKFKGERFSMIFFTVQNFDRAGKEARRDAVDAGAEWPSWSSLSALMNEVPLPAKNASQ